MSEIETASHLLSSTSSMVMDGVGTVGFLALVGVALLTRARKRAEARAAEATFKGDRPLEAGGAVLFGKVERAEGAENAVRVEIDQHGTESRKSDELSHTWTETSRRVLVEPFYLRLASGERVRVEPGSDVFLVDEMDGCISVNQTTRTRYAELTPDKQVYASGELVRAQDPESQKAEGYRGKPAGFVLRPSRGGKMLISAQPLGERFLARARFHGKWAAMILLIALSFHVVFMSFHVRRWTGRATTAPITKLDHSVSKSEEGHDVHHYTVVVTPNERTGPVPVGATEDSFSRLHEGDVVPVRLVEGRFSSFTTLGPDLTVAYPAWAALPLLLGTALAYLLAERKTRPWYEHKLVEKRPGRLL